MSLSAAIKRFEMHKDADTMSDLVQQAMIEWTNADISDETLAIHLERAAKWLRENE